jgi:hypothetical protein
LAPSRANLVAVDEVAFFFGAVFALVLALAVLFAVVFVLVVFPLSLGMLDSPNLFNTHVLLSADGLPKG